MLTDIEDVVGSSQADALTGDGEANILIGLGGADAIRGMGGDDTLRIQGTPAMVDGGAGIDTLSVTAKATLNDTNFAGIERVIVYGGGGVDMSGVGAGLAPALIRSQSAPGTQAVITGTQGADVIAAGRGNDSITGGLGADRIVGGSGASTINGSGGGDGDDVFIAGSGAETFNERMAGFGRDLVYKADLSQDYIDLAGLGANLHLVAIDGGKDTLIYGDAGRGTGTDQVVLMGIGLADAQAAYDNAHIHSTPMA